MNRRSLLAVLLSCGAPASLALAAEAAPRLSPRGFGAVRFGDRLAAVERGLAQRATPAGMHAAPCAFVRFRKYPRVRFMVENGIVTRADAAAGVPNSAGVAVGMSLRRVRRLHPEARLQPHKYDPRGHYLILPGAGGRAALVIEASADRVTNIRPGLRPAVDYVEGCS